MGWPVRVIAKRGGCASLRNRRPMPLVHVHVAHGPEVHLGRAGHAQVARSLARDRP
jgi:hypothetical protein